MPHNNEAVPTKNEKKKIWCELEKLLDKLNLVLLKRAKLSMR